MSYREAQHYLKKGDTVECRLCPHRCNIHEGRSGVCGVREIKRGFSILLFMEK
jgi:uncharacterized Fe-S radical SAM superfamily protein PflX